MCLDKEAKQCCNLNVAVLATARIAECHHSVESVMCRLRFNVFLTIEREEDPDLPDHLFLCFICVFLF